MPTAIIAYIRVSTHKPLYLVQVTPSASSTTNVSGRATLAGTAQANFTPGTYAERSYTILTAAGGRTGMRASRFPSFESKGSAAHVNRYRHMGMCRRQ
jgi:hypothetical protein